MNHPFQVVLVDPRTGLAKLVLKERENLEVLAGKTYVMDVYPYDCKTGAHGEKTKLIIDVCDSGEKFNFDQISYDGFIFENEFDSKIICLENAFKAANASTPAVCSYRVITPSVPFNVNEVGCIYNTRILDFNSSDEKKIEFQVLAEYCDNQGVSIPVVVNIKVLCNHLNWIGVQGKSNSSFRSHIGNNEDVKDIQDEYFDDRDIDKIMNKAKLDFCDNSCLPSLMIALFNLHLEPLSEDSESLTMYSLQTLYKLCGVLTDVLDLLPNKSEPKIWTTNLPINAKGSENFYPEFNFDGITTYTEIFLDQSIVRFIEFPFAVSWAMRRTSKEKFDDSEHLLCFVNEVDSSLYVKLSISLHECKLLLRNYRDESTATHVSGMKESKHFSEWNWSLNEVCDGEWHDYIVSLGMNKVVLHVDGKEVDKILFDGFLFGSLSPRNSQVHRLYVGACRQEGCTEMDGFLRASLSALHITLNDTPNSNTIKCLKSFHDKLEINDISLRGSDNGYYDDFKYNLTRASRSKKVKITTKNMHLLESLVSQVVLVRSPLPQVPWKRIVEVQTSVECQDGRRLVSEVLHVNILENDDEFKMFNGKDKINIGKWPEEKVLKNVLLNLSRTLSFKEVEYKAGVRFMKDLKIFTPNKEMKSNKLVLLDACLVQFDTKLVKHQDEITGFQTLASKQHLAVAVYDFGISFSGVGRKEDYEALLSSLILKTAEARRSFNVGCSFKGAQTRIISAMMDIIHEDPGMKNHQLPHHLMANKVIHPAMFDNLQLIAKPFPVNFKYNNSDDSGAGVALVIIICIGFIVLLVVLGIVRIRSLQTGEDSSRASVEDPEFNIILNPIHPDNLSKKEDDGCFQKNDSANKNSIDAEDSEEESFGTSDETQRDWRHSAVLL